ncbi:hypothetical protein ACP70R_015166 [Stipagrostis hirtigluma subsp. patula]
MDDVIEEIILRFPPDDPASLVRTALVCKQWCRLVSGPDFRRRFAEFHRAAPMLGFFCNVIDCGDGAATARFFRNSSCPSYADHLNYFALDACHGRVLLHNTRSAPPPQGLDPCLLAAVNLVVWDPTTDELRELPMLFWLRGNLAWTAVVLCVAAARGGACDHLNCHDGSFLVVFMGILHGNVFVYVYSSEAGAWGLPTKGLVGYIASTYLVIGPAILVGDALHFALDDGRKIITYHLGVRALSTITTPSLDMRFLQMGNMGLVMIEDNRLGVAGVDGYILHLWSWRDCVNRVNAGEWEHSQVIDLCTMLSVADGDLSCKLHVVGFAEGTDIIFISTNDGVFTVELNSSRVKKVLDRGYFYGVVPYVNFYTPGTI